MKVFKPFYYSVLAVLTAVILVFSCFSFTGRLTETRIDPDDAGAHVKAMTTSKTASVWNSTEHNAREYYIIKTLVDGTTYGGFKQYYAGSDPAYDYIYTEDAIITGESAVNMVVSVSTAVSNEDQQKYYEERTGQDATEHYMITYTKNVIAYMPASKNYPSSEVILINVNYDSSDLGANATGLSGVAAALETIRVISSSTAFKSKQYTNDFMFVFSDAKENGLLGSYILRDRFQGFGDAYSRVRLALDFTTYGTGGVPVLYETSANNSALISKWSSVNKNIYSSSLFQTINSVANYDSNIKVFKDSFPSISIATVADTERQHTQLDDQPSKATIRYFGNLMLNSLESFGKADLETFKSDSDSVYFSVFGLFTIVYDKLLAYVLGGVVLFLAAMVVLLNLKNKVFSFLQVGKGAIIQLIAIAFSVGAGYGTYYLICGILALFGAVNINAIATLNYSSIPLLFSAGAISVCFALAVYVLFKRLLLVKATDVVRANVLIWALLAVVFSFSVPEISYLFVYTAILELIVLGLTVLFKDSFRQRFKMDMDRLFLYNIPIIMTLPLIIPAYLFLAEMLGASFYPLITMLAVLMCGFIAPYFDYLKGALDRFVKLLPSASIIVVSNEIEKVEDKAKKGKFVEVSVKKQTRVKQTNSYKNRYGIAFCLVLSLILVFVFSVVGKNFADNKSLSVLAKDRLLIDDALIYVVDESNNEKPYTNYWMVKDYDIMNRVSKAVYDLEWNSDLKAYIREDKEDITKGAAASYVPLFSLDSRDGTKVTFTVDSKRDDIYYSLTFAGASNIKSILLKKAYNNLGSEHTSLSYDLTTNPVRNENGDFVIKNLRMDVTVVVEAFSGAYSGMVSYSGGVSHFLSAQTNDETILRGMAEWEALKTYYFDNEDIHSRLKATMLISKTETIGNL